MSNSLSLHLFIDVISCGERERDFQFGGGERVERTQHWRIYIIERIFRLDDEKATYIVSLRSPFSFISTRCGRNPFQNVGRLRGERFFIASLSLS